MLDSEITIVPLETAHAVLSAFGIGSDDSEYQRSRQVDGFRLVDLENVLCNSRFVLSVDWREWLQDAIDTIVD